MNIEAGEEGFLDAIDAGSEEIERDGFVLISLPCDLIGARLGIDGAGVGFSEE